MNARPPKYEASTPPQRSECFLQRLRELSGVQLHKNESVHCYMTRSIRWFYGTFFRKRVLHHSKMRVHKQRNVIEAARKSETSVNFYQTTRRYNPEDRHLHTRRPENLKSYTCFLFCILHKTQNKYSIIPNCEQIKS
jgi:hypothetical protein